MTPERAPELPPTQRLAELPRPTTKLPKPLRRFLVRQSGRWDVIPTEQVDWIESVRNYVILHCGKDRHVIRDTLVNLEERLPASEFVRVSRSAMAAFRCIQNLDTRQGSGLFVTLRDGTQLPASRGVRDLIRRIESA